MTKQKRREHNLKKIATLQSVMMPKIRAVITDLESHGWKPRIVSARRTKAEQAEKVRLGYSKTMKSKHVDGLAVDIVDDWYGYDSQREFWLMLGSSYLAHGLYWGGLFGLDSVQRGKLLVIMQVTKRWNEPVKLGWDVSHGEKRD